MLVTVCRSLPSLEACMAVAQNVAVSCAHMLCNNCYTSKPSKGFALYCAVL